MRIDPASPSRLVAGAAQIEITPPLEVGLLMSSIDGKWEPFEGVRTPLKARILVLEFPSIGSTNGSPERMAVVSLDLLTLAGRSLGGFREFKFHICSAAQNLISPDRIVLVCTHTHSAPESGGLTNLYHTEEFKQWTIYLTKQIGTAIASACNAARPCYVECGSSLVPKLGIHRRFKTKHGIMMSHPAPPAELILSRSGAVDDSVNVATVRDMSDELVAILVNGTCHPVYEMCCPMISADYPGELSSALEESHSGATAMFLNGAAGNINPPGVSAGAEAAREHGRKLALAVEEVLTSTLVRQHCDIEFRRRQIRLPTRLPAGKDIGETIQTELCALRIGSAAFVFIPGEPFAEIGLTIRAASPFPFTAIVGFSESSIGYIPTDEAFAEGGYETIFGHWSYLSSGSADVICRDAVRLLREMGVNGGVAAGTTSAPHLRDVTRSTTKIS